MSKAREELRRARYICCRRANSLGFRSSIESFQWLVRLTYLKRTKLNLTFVDNTASRSLFGNDSC
jgi:hypothetical protein